MNAAQDALPTRNRAARSLRFARNLARWGLPRRSLLFGPLSLGDDLLCTAVLRETRRRGTPFTMMTARPELFLGNPDPAGIIPIDNDFVAGLRRLGAIVVQPYYIRLSSEYPPRDILPSHHIVAEMCALAGLHGDITIRPYLHLSEEELAAAPKLPRQIAIQSTCLTAAIPYPTKEWGAERFAAAVRSLRPEFKLVQIGRSDDAALPVDLDLRGQTTLRQAAAVLATSFVFVGLEGFLAHLARSVDCPAAIVHGGRAPEGIFSYACNRNFFGRPPCSPCGLRADCPNNLVCLTAISPEAVAQAARELARVPPARPLKSEMAVLP